MRITKQFTEFFNNEKASGLLLIICTALSLAVTNSPAGATYASFWNTGIGGHPLTHWINDGLMTVFFLLVGLEIEREIIAGELKGIKNAMLPVFAAIGGMVVPALIHFSLNRGTATQSGFGIPMATDIAFALAVLSLAGKRVPLPLKIFLTALAIIDDLGAILVIAFFYAGHLSWLHLLIALGIFIALLILRRAGVRNLAFYILPGLAMWYFVLQSGVHATISGVLLAFAIPFSTRNGVSPSARLQHILHKPVGFIILPLFALANTCIVLEPSVVPHLKDNNSLGIMLGLFVGKPVGIFLATMLAVKWKLGRLQPGIRPAHIFSAGLLGGIGFTMSVFITLLAFSDPALITVSKISILAVSLLSGVTGLVFLFLTTPEQIQPGGVA